MKNIVFLLWDNIRADHVSLIPPWNRDTTPFLRSLAPNSLVFTQAIAHSYWSIPSIFSMFTGKRPKDHRMTMTYCSGPHGHCPNPNKLLTQDLQELGFSTFGYPDTDWFGSDIGFDRGFDVLYNQKTMREGSGANMRTVVDTIKQTFRPEGNFFLYVNPLDAAAPYPTPEAFRKWTKSEHLPTSVNHYFTKNLAESWGENQYQQLRDRFDDSILYLDTMTRELCEWLEKEGHLDNTIIVIASDHGEYFGEHGFMHHTAGLYDISLRVPLIINTQGKGRVISRQFETRHLYTLIKEMAQGNKPDPNDFTSEYMTIRSPVPRLVVNHFRLFESDYDNPHLFSAKNCVRTENWKYIENSRVGDELYDLVSDPGETNNIFNPDDLRVKRAKEELEQ